MASATLINHLDSALQEVVLLVKHPSRGFFLAELFRYDSFGIRNLKMFVLSSRKLMNKDSSDLESFLVRIERIVRKRVQSIRKRRCCLDCPTCCVPGWVPLACLLFTDDSIQSLASDIESLQEEIDQFYVRILDASASQQSKDLPIKTHQIVEIINSFLENFVEYQSRYSIIWRIQALAEMELEALMEQMRFFQSLVLFIIRRNGQLGDDLFAHTERVAIAAAYFSFKWQSFKLDDPSICEELRLKIQSLTQKIRPIDPHVYNTYTDALRCSKLARRSSASTNQEMDDDGLAEVKNFLHRLISYLWDLLLSINIYGDFATRDQLQELYEGLRSLRIILKQQQQGSFHLKIKEDVVDVVCDAGILIVSLHQTDMQHVASFHDLLQITKLRLAEIVGKNSQVQLIKPLGTTQLAFVDFLLEQLMEHTSCEVESTAKCCAQTIQIELVSLRSFLGKIVELRHEHEELQILWDRILEVTYRIEHFFDCLADDDLSNSCSTTFDSIMEDMRNIMPEINVKTQDIQVKEVTKTHDHMPLQRTPSLRKVVVGFHRDAELIMDRLKRGSKQLRIIGIVGMPGLGKTTLATKVYNDLSISHHFVVRAWLCVSLTMDRKNALLDLLTQIAPEKYSGVTQEMTTHEAADRLRRSLKGRTYLIVFDDIWETEAWNDLKDSFPEDHMGSRILFTSRNHDVAPSGMLDEKPHEPRPLNEEESLELVHSQLPARNGQPTALNEFGRQIAEICKGLPLLVLLVAGVLKSTEPENWRKILNKLSSDNLSGSCRDTLELSYRYLPEHLKPCFLYFGTFKEDEKVSARRLLYLWMAEGFVRNVEGKRLRDIAEDYLKDLISRSLVMVAEQRWDGGVKACFTHDLIREFCLQKAKDEQFLHFIEGGYDELLAFNEPRTLRRLVVHSTAALFIESKIFCPHARSLRFSYHEEDLTRNISFSIHCCKLLRVLDLEKINLGPVFPGEIGLLTRLAFLAIKGGMSDISPSICNLSDLQTLIVYIDGNSSLSLPDNFWNLRKLKHLSVKNGHGSAGFRFSLENLDSSNDLYELDRISAVVLPYLSSIHKLMEKFPKIRKFKCIFEVRGDVGSVVGIVVPHVLNKLESLSLRLNLYSPPEELKYEFTLTPSLKKLDLSYFKLSQQSLSSIGKLPNLEVLRLIGTAFEGDSWTMEDEEFAKLRFLKLESWSLVRWNSTTEDQLGCLEELKLSRCDRLEDLPSCLENISTFEKIELWYCSDNVEKSVKKIKELYEDMGNTDLKHIIHSSEDIIF